ncbi:MAG: hypothetical protein RR865_07160 [Clostridia bacterium]
MTEPTQGRLWIRLMKHHRIERDLLVPCTRDDPHTALREAMHTLDLSQPVWLPKHEADWENYALTRFKPEDFMDAVHFDAMELCYVAPDEDKKQAQKRSLMQDL